MKNTFRKSILMIVLGVGLVAPLGAGSGLADDENHDRALEAVRTEGILPLATLIKSHRALRGSRIIEIELERDGGRYIYELEVILPNGRIKEFQFDAKTGKAVAVKDDERD